MLLKKIEIVNYRHFKNISIDLQKNDKSSLYSIASNNGGGKSTLLQFVFILLHCFTEENRKSYLKNMFENNIKKSISKHEILAKFILEDSNNEYSIEFIQSPVNYEDKNYDLYLDIKDIEIDLIKSDNVSSKINAIENLITEVTNQEIIGSRISPTIDLRLRKISRLIETKEEHFLYKKWRHSNSDITIARKLLSLIQQRFLSAKENIEEISILENKIKFDLKKLIDNLKKDNLSYVMHLDKKNVLLVKSNAPRKILEKISESIFLTAPASQVFLFLERKDRSIIFNEFPSNEPCYESYYEKIKKSKNDLPNFFTYDFAPTELILESFKKSSEEDLRIKRKTGSYGSKYDELKNELKNLLDEKEVTENENGDRVIFRIKGSNKELLPEDLSHGELKKLGTYIWLKYIVHQNSIVLMDEVDIALHPKWQYKLAQDLKNWSTNNQFLLATHSPQILSSTHYKNIIKLDNGEVKRYNKPPIDRDINAIITEIMGAPDFPEDLLKLHKQYRQLMNDGQLESDEAKALKQDILEYESESSSFFQDINFELELM